jgi:chemotaxis methyl-accepting protein methylase
MDARGSGDADLSLESSGFLRWLFSQTGLDVRAYRPESLARRLPACLRALGARTLPHARAILEHDKGLMQTAVSAMLVGVTSFFRDPSVFDTLRRHILPQLARARAGLYVWSAGCSDGSELYSVGMILAEMSLLAGSYLLGTDCREDAIQQAKAGVYESGALKSLPPGWRERYFHPRGDGRWQLETSLLASVRWRLANLLTGQEPGVWDVVLCRNTTMYMRGEASAPLWSRFETALRPGGVLVVGKAERPVGVKRLTPLAPCIFQRSKG